jgi:Flp pilus assembly protein TadG
LEIEKLEANMNHKDEKGQTLIIIAFAMIVLIGFTALAIDGSMVFSDRRHAQNAADTAAMAGALAYTRGSDIFASAQTRATSNGYDNASANSIVVVNVLNSPSGVCPAGTLGKDIQVDITSYVKTTFARVLGRTQVTNAVTATSRACGSYSGPPFNGNAIVSLAPSGVGYDGTGNPYWLIEGGGIFSNSISSNAAYCNGSATITAPSVTVVGSTNLAGCDAHVGSEIEGAGQYMYSDYSRLLPRQPECDGAAYKSSGRWNPQPNKDGSRVSLDDDMDFAPGLYCITNSPGPYHGEITGADVTFYAMRADFTIKFDGSGNSFTAQAPASGEYAGILLFAAPQLDANGNLLNTQAIDLRGNGDGDIIGTIIAPSADVTMFGNSGTAAINSQIIAYQVDAGGGANIHVSYNAGNNYRVALPNTLTLLK